MSGTLGLRLRLTIGAPLAWLKGGRFPLCIVALGCEDGPLGVPNVLRISAISFIQLASARCKCVTVLFDLSSSTVSTELTANLLSFLRLGSSSNGSS